MKKSLYVLLSFSFLLFASVHQTAGAQIIKSVTVSKSALTNTDTAKATFSADKTYMSVEATVTKTSGTVAGIVKLQGSFDGINYDDLNTLTLADQALNRKVMPIPIPLIYPLYRVIFISSGTNVTAVSAKLLRRSE